ncbi:hypothetical protein SIO70_08060 [Chitinophaga sancti]|uniref:hypothetical protein n=1 Tax=Chitinophaga sancti TaxID=1004 RepID=UPI002A747948|nr:hypothetical protein [Chitinophaga sancti]WPQ64821.1 hypothetical protein SIO70_08060 [Chitinophaga sancti]
MNKIIKNWSFFRIIRLIAGIILIGVAIQMQLLIIAIFGTMIIIQALVNTTCCDSCNNGSCNTR